MEDLCKKTFYGEEGSRRTMRQHIQYYKEIKRAIVAIQVVGCAPGKLLRLVVSVMLALGSGLIIGMI